MAAVAAEANIAGSGSTSAPAQVLYSAGSILLNGDASIGGDVTGTFGLQAAIVGDAQATFSPKIEAGAVADLQGQATVTAALPVLLLQASVSGDADVVAGAEVAVDAVSALSGQASQVSDVDMVYAGTSAISGDADITVDADMALSAIATLSGQAITSFDPLGDLEMASDLAGDASVSPSTEVAYAGAAVITGQARISAVGLVRRPRTQLAALQAPAPSERSIGFQPNRESVENTRSFRVTVPAQRLPDRRIPLEVDPDATGSLRRTRGNTIPSVRSSDDDG